MSKLIDAHAMLRRVIALYEKGAVDLSYYNIVKEAVQMEPAVEAEPRVLTLDELTAIEPFTVVYIEICGDPEIRCHVMEWIGRARIEPKGEEPFARMVFSYYTAAEEDYGAYWRCWTGKPTFEQMTAVPWEMKGDEVIVF